MKILLTTTALLLATAGAAHAQTQPPPREASQFVTETGHEWRNFGADRAYPTREAAIADMPRVLRARGYPEPVIALFVEAMQRPGTRTRVVNGETLGFMRSGSNEIWTTVRVNFARPPVAGMEYAAPSEEWTVTYEGVTYTIGIPDICNNIYERIRVRVEDECAYIHLQTEAGDRQINHALFDSWLPSGCGPALRFVPAGTVDNGGRNASDWRPLPTHCPEGPCDFRAVIEATGRELTQSGGWRVEGPGTYIVRVSRQFALNNLAVFCIRHPNVDSCGIDVREGNDSPTGDYHGWIATIHHDQDDIPSNWTWRRLWWAVPDRYGVCPPD